MKATKHPILFMKLLSVWSMMPDLVKSGIEKGYAAREPRPGWVPLKGLSPLSDWEPPEAYAMPGWAKVHNRIVRKFRRRLAFSASWSGISRGDLLVRIQVFEDLYTRIARYQQENSPASKKEDITA
jgi:hypothetical protein